MPKITFIVSHTPKGSAADIPTYQAGETYDLETSYAEKYVRRGWAKPAEEDKKSSAPSGLASVGERGPEIVPPVEETGSRRFRRRVAADVPPALPDDQGSEKPQD